MLDARVVRALLFDLGGVIIEIDFDRVFRSWCPRSQLTLDQIRERFAMDDAYQRHERGEIDASQYFAYLRATLELSGSDDEIAAGWNTVYVREISETLRDVTRAQRKLPCFAFSNTNPTHHAAWPAVCPNVDTAFERIFVSSEVGARKPEPAAFEAVANAAGVRLSSMVLFDDTKANVEGARAVGMQAVHVRRPSDVTEALSTLGVFS
jgi:FMN phosphatase YigB (HAD superfamily)